MRFSKSILFFLASIFASHQTFADEAWVRCYGHRLYPNPHSDIPPLLRKEIKLWVDELSNVNLSMVLRRISVKQIENSQRLQDQRLEEQYFLLPGSLEETRGYGKVYVVQPHIYDDLIRLCVQTLNRGYGRKSENFPDLFQDFYLDDIKAVPVSFQWWFTKTEYSIYRMDEKTPEILDDVPFGIESKKYPDKHNREIRIASQHLHTLTEIFFRRSHSK